jgi:carbon-monoxide dehydrogenase medium subunit
LFRPSTINSVFKLLKGGVRLLAGGTDLILWASQNGQPRKLVWIGNIESLHTFTVDGDQLQVGAGVTLGELIRCAAFRRAAPAVVDSAQLVGSVQIRNQATLLGNVCSASPAGDTLPALLVHEAHVEIAESPDQQRRVSLHDFLLGPGQTVLAPGELVLGISLCGLQANEVSAYRRHTERQALDLAFASVAARLTFETDGYTVAGARLALGAVGPTALVAIEAAESLVGQPLTKETKSICATIAAETCKPISDFRASADYRRQLVKVLVEDVISELEQRAQFFKPIGEDQ